MKKAVVNVSELDLLVLTKDGAVVGYVEIRNIGSAGDVEFIGRAVNTNSFPKSVTYHGFACGTALSTKNPEEVASAENFIKALCETQGASK
jgi:hypothetical protein